MVLIFVACAALLTVACGSWATEIFVAPDGNDRNPGTREKPLATPEAARNALRRRHAAPGAVVTFRGGIYARGGSFTLEARDSGTPRRPVTYRAAAGEQVRFVGGRQIPGESFIPVTAKTILNRLVSPRARRRLMQVDLHALGIHDFGDLSVRGFGGTGTLSHMELFFNGRRMQLARYPNEGGFLRVAGQVSADTFRCRSKRLARWTKAPDAWFHGYWKHIWADLYVPVASIDPRAGTVRLAAGDTGGFEKGRPFYAVNLLDEIDTPGEWYLDRRTGRLYFWPPSDPAGADIHVSVIAEPLLVMTGARHVRLRGLTFEIARGELATVSAGRDVAFEDCLFRNAGTTGVRIEGVHCGLERCEIAACGDCGVILSGGHRPSLKPGGNFLRNCHAHHFGQWRKTYTPGVAFEGVAHQVAHNHLHDGPHAAILFSGNNHLVEFNHIHDVGQYASNGGAIYTGLGWDQRGSVIRYNYIHDLRGRIPGGEYGVMGIYLDDCNSGQLVHGNILCDVVGYGLLIGGGRDNVITNNILVRCTEAFAVDSRGIERINNTPGAHWNFLEWMRRAGIRYRRGVWAMAYPALARIPDSWEQISQGNWRYPEDCVFARNLGFGNVKFILANDNNGTGTLNKFALVADNVEDADPRFVDPPAGNLALRADSPALAIPGFEPIPFDRIGPQ